MGEGQSLTEGTQSTIQTRGGLCPDDRLAKVAWFPFQFDLVVKGYLMSPPGATVPFQGKVIHCTQKPYYHHLPQNRGLGKDLIISGRQKGPRHPKNDFN